MKEKEYKKEAKELGMSIQELAEYRIEIKKEIRSHGLEYDKDAPTQELFNILNTKR